MLLAKKLHRHAPQEGPSVASRMGPLASPGARGRRQKQQWDKKKYVVAEKISCERE